jgi:hypothetical protein
MKRQWLGVLGVAFLAAVLAVVSAPVEAGDLQCDVPFRFLVGDKELPAGTYLVTMQLSTLAVRGTTTGAVSIGNRVDAKSDGASKLVFHRYGDEYVLREAWTGRTGREIPTSRRERELKTRVAKFETVVIPLS